MRCTVDVDQSPTPQAENADGSGKHIELRLGCIWSANGLIWALIFPSAASVTTATDDGPRSNDTRPTPTL